MSGNGLGSGSPIGAPVGAAIGAALLGADRATATVDAVCEALLSGRGWLHPASSLTVRPADRTPLLDLVPEGREREVLPGVGAVVGWDGQPAGGSPAAAPAPVGRSAALLVLQRLGEGPVLGLDLTGPQGPGPDAFHLPVTAEPAPAELRRALPAALAELLTGLAEGAADGAFPGPRLTPDSPGVRVRMALPPVFHSLLAGGGPEELSGHLAETAEEVLAGARGRARADWAVVTAATADALREAGVLFAGVCRLDVAGRESTATLVATVAPLPGLPHEDAAPALAAALAADRPHAEVRRALLPCGPAVLLVEARTTPVPAALAEDGRRRLFGTAAVQVLVPLPGGGRLLTVQLSTSHERDWELYGAAFAQVLRSVEIAWDGVVNPAGTREPDPDPEPEPATAEAPPAAPVAPAAPEPDPEPPAPAPAPPAPAPVEYDPFGTPLPAPAPAPAPRPAPAAAPATAGEDTKPGKGTPVRVPPADWDPWGAAPAPATPAPPAAEDTSSDKPAKGTPVQIPPADWDPWS